VSCFFNPQHPLGIRDCGPRRIRWLAVTAFGHVASRKWSRRLRTNPTHRRAANHAAGARIRTVHPLLSWTSPTAYWFI